MARTTVNGMMDDFQGVMPRNMVIAVGIASLLLAVPGFWTGHLRQAIVFVVVGAVLLVLAALYWRRPMPESCRFSIVLLLSALVISLLQYHGTLAVYWVFPLLAISYFLFKGWVAIAVASVATLVVSIAGFLVLPLEHAWRMMAALLIILVLGSVFTTTIGRLQQLLHRLVVTDTLTGLQNRHQVNDVLSRLIHNFRRYQRPASLILLDIDHFKQVNDTHGHLYGDQMLKQLATRLQATLRVNDHVFRVGGEEFLVALPETAFAEALTVAEKIRLAVAERPFEGKDATSQLTVSLGVAQLRGEQSWSEWISVADLALLEAKRKGRNQVVKGRAIVQ
ncbi:diguanylate cyclase (GGDEF) domain-containing protein [Pseudidiomarina indica]|uniref:diguanylate cyclase n=1 Tax=Pseudidiomarina indica TaxID=1159017 RepID=A0A1G6BTD3_9GAMM|nr:GGDEF domain-containing protein [Pseudidiomarina indica]SDB23889.1 diguanylate cyclase (GGDEF) domain-containing protein [Pseudidiomarina indica]